MSKARAHRVGRRLDDTLIDHPREPGFRWHCTDATPETEATPRWTSTATAARDRVRSLSHGRAYDRPAGGSRTIRDRRALENIGGASRDGRCPTPGIPTPEAPEIRATMDLVSVGGIS